MIQIVSLPNCIKSSYSNRKQLCLLPTPKKHKRDRNMSKQSEARRSQMVPKSQSVMIFLQSEKASKCPRKFTFLPPSPSVDNTYRWTMTMFTTNDQRTSGTKHIKTSRVRKRRAVSETSDNTVTYFLNIFTLLVSY